MRGISCLKGCGASIENIKEYCELCRLPESRETLYARYQVILRQREQAYKRIEEAKATAAYMEEKVKHYEQILSGFIPDDSNPETWTEDARPDKYELWEWAAAFQIHVCYFTTHEHLHKVHNFSMRKIDGSSRSLENCRLIIFHTFILQPCQCAGERAHTRPARPTAVLFLRRPASGSVLASSGPG